MSYLNRDERREVILQAAMLVALEEGFSAMTVRRIAAEAHVATGQVHHHFASAGELKSQAFVRLIRTLLDAELVSEDASFRERLHAMLGSEDGGLEPYIKLWREAQVVAGKDPEIKSAYLLTMRMWHEETANIITQGQKAGEFSSAPDAADVAWRLIALVCGLDGMYILGIEEMADPAFDRHLDRMITQELFI
ncbi:MULTISPECIES: TetR family transcriptional regulator [Citrobacter]|uniref:TetR family transcriptional regulator n=1 Tax=Citrobacter TaxID=544 RepID=UPI000FEB6E57|nr:MULTISPECIES: TetR family transcriptional regulator [Citrobacter]RWT95497.1 TetR family transcriptional regulator [Citrobacter freundii]MDM2876457.1 TetR family transcriptional regulator [Citrobacter sp. Cpo040]MDT3751824.1 TetR family transcriptional regulator [Citrobacter freundii complex sp. 2023EL-00966]MDV0515244.1 TetR family transcriptional regulator [Citrobacter portucalensis]MDV0520420.1 TetR family transcriptional regulator [Citrobacter portucalensis]